MQPSTYFAYWEFGSQFFGFIPQVPTQRHSWFKFLPVIDSGEHFESLDASDGICLVIRFTFFEFSLSIESARKG